MSMNYLDLKERPMAKKLYSFLHPSRRRVQTELPEGSQVQQEFAKELDINYLVEKHVRAGIPFPTATRDQFMDVSSLPNFQEASDAVRRAEESWMSLDAKIRRHFGDKMENFLGALHDKSRVDELVRLKVFKKPPEQPKGQPGGSGEAPAKQEGGGKPPGTVVT